ncbi:MAG: LytTR family DNA-binding domain-containing protein [Myxococcales bacterium]|nr:LytTR family DNA-binding domain-containing protein [Myxococcales bacterium]
MTLRAIVVDDEPLARDELTFLLGQCEGVDVVGEARFAAEAEKLCDHVEPQVAFIDLRMPGPDGLALADTLREKHPELEVVLVSAHDDGALRGFEAQITDYLLKPVRLERLRQTLDRVAAAHPDLAPDSIPLKRFAVRRKNTYVVVDLHDVIYFEAREELVWAVTAEDRFAIDRTLAALAEQLDSADFFQSHRSCIVRVNCIRLIEPVGARTFRMLLDHPEDPKVPLARDRVGKLRERIPFLR